MFRDGSTPITNVFEVLLGSDKIKWDPIWNVLHWLCHPEEGHGLGPRFRDEFCQFAWGEVPGSLGIKQEFRIDPDSPGDGKWPDLALAAPNLESPFTHLALMDDLDQTSPGSSRKLGNLAHYAEAGRKRIGDGKLRLLVLTNAPDGQRFGKLRETMGEAAENATGSYGWRILPLRTVADWTESALKAAPERAHPVLRDWVTWCSR